MEKAVQSLCFGDNAATLPAHIAAGPSQGQKLKKEDIDFIVSILTPPLSVVAGICCIADHCTLCHH